MYDIFYPTLICIAAGLSTVLGGILALYIKVQNFTILQKLLAVSSGIIVAISIFCLVPEGYYMLQLEINTNFCFVILGLSICFGIILSRFINSLFYENVDTLSKRHIFKTGILVMVMLMIHNFPEGIITFITSIQDVNVGTVVAISIIMHNIPEGAAIALPIYFSTNSRKKAIFYSFLGGVSEPFGAILAGVFIKNTFNYVFMAIVIFLIAGFMLDFGFNNILRKNCNIISFKKAFLYFMLGLLLIMIIIFFIK